MRKAGWVAALVTKPRCEHHHAWCKPYVYGAVRYNPAHINRGAEVIREKWGYDIPYLSGYRGNGWMKDTIARPTGKNWHRDAVAGKKWKDEGLWARIGELQLTFLKAHGLKPGSTLLDVGCGALRFGVHAAKFLKPGHYWGIDKEPDLIAAGKSLEAQRFEVSKDRLEHLYTTSTWDVPGNVLFDYMIAHSVFTHVAPELIEACLVKLVPRLKPTGRFFATFHESRTGAIDRGVELKGYQAWRKGEVHNTHYPFSLFEELAAKAGARAEYIGDWSHPFNKLGRQMMMEIRPK
jgi:SAM-dependent methyltransferase